jgi:uncharacterized integral membrane protein
MKYLYALTVLLMALFLAAFIQQNGQDVVLKYFYWKTIPLPLSLFMILAFAGGYALAVIVGLSTGIRGRIRTASAQREARRLRAELGSLRESQEGGSSSGSLSGDAQADERSKRVEKAMSEETALLDSGGKETGSGGEEKGER